MTRKENRAAQKFLIERIVEWERIYRYYGDYDSREVAQAEDMLTWLRGKLKMLRKPRNHNIP